MSSPRFWGGVAIGALGSWWIWARPSSTGNSTGYGGPSVPRHYQYSGLRRFR